MERSHNKEIASCRQECFWKECLQVDLWWHRDNCSFSTHLLDGNGNKITLDVEFVNHGYYVDGTYSTTVTKVHEDETVDPEYVYFDNASNWENVYCYFYNGKHLLPHGQESR